MEQSEIPHAHMRNTAHLFMLIWKTNETPYAIAATANEISFIANSSTTTSMLIRLCCGKNVRTVEYSLIYKRVGRWIRARGFPVH
jgi:hypothetical protein